MALGAKLLRGLTIERIIEGVEPVVLERIAKGLELQLSISGTELTVRSVYRGQPQAEATVDLKEAIFGVAWAPLP